LSLSNPNSINLIPAFLLSLKGQCRQEEQQRKEKVFQEDVHGSARRWSIRAIDELRGALRRQAKPSCKEFSRYPCRLGSIGNPLDVAVRVICPHIKEEL
jgi:hypothetical protein